MKKIVMGLLSILAVFGIASCGFMFEEVSEGSTSSVKESVASSVEEVSSVEVSSVEENSEEESSIEESSEEESSEVESSEKESSDSEWKDIEFPRP